LLAFRFTHKVRPPISRLLMVGMSSMGFDLSGKTTAPHPVVDGARRAAVTVSWPKCPPGELWESLKATRWTQRLSRMLR